MHYFSITLSVATALTALTAAVPHAHNRAYEQLHARAVKLAPLIVGRAQSSDGSCGGDSGFTCAAGFCCSEWGFCGQSDSYCGAGCQSKFGTCGSNSVSTAGAQTKNHPQSTTTAHTTRTSTLTGKASTFSTTTTYVVVTTFVTVKASAVTVTASHASTASSTSTRSKSSTAAASSSISSSSGSGSGLGDKYKLYLGDGTTADGWPSKSKWTNFESMWSNNMALISISCTEFGEANNSDKESDELKSAIQSVASSSGVDERFILAVVMQESKGCVRAPTTNYGVTNPGLMQSHDGAGSCNNDGVQDPCPSSEIKQMIKDGTTGTSSGDGLKQTLAESGASDVSKYYKAARIYNSGSIAPSGNLEDGIATHCYSSDIANRLTGWVNAATKCTLG